MTVVRNLRPQITGMLLSKWNFNPDFISVGEESEDWFRNHQDKADLCDLVMVAQYHSFIGTDMMSSLPPISTLPAFSKLGMTTLTPVEILQFLKDSKAEIEATESLLGGI